jgi:hypothetical protein
MKTFAESAPEVSATGRVEEQAVQWRTRWHALEQFGNMSRHARIIPQPHPHILATERIRISMNFARITGSKRTDFCDAHAIGAVDLARKHTGGDTRATRYTVFQVKRFIVYDKSFVVFALNNAV